MSNIESNRTKRTQKDYTLGFRLAVVSSVEKGDMTYKQATTIDHCATPISCRSKSKLNYCRTLHASFNNYYFL